MASRKFLVAAACVSAVTVSALVFAGVLMRPEPPAPGARSYDSVESMVEALRGSPAACRSHLTQVSDIRDLGLADQRSTCRSGVGDLWFGQYQLPARRDEEMRTKGWRDYAWGSNWLVQVKDARYNTNGEGARAVAEALGGIVVE